MRPLLLGGPVGGTVLLAGTGPAVPAFRLLRQAPVRPVVAVPA